ncbi:MAG TPA: hypothetical protein ENG30_01730, partial [Thermofilaceae archaeon]|nr:hypothetical protein [Thermofilaceae archaeon]
ELFEAPEKWLERSFEEVLEMRLSLVRGVDYADVRKGGRVVERLRELAISSIPVEIEMRFLKPPRTRPLFDPHAPPMGPSGLLEGVRILGNPRVERPVEKVYYDTDMGAWEAVVELYKARIPISTIQRLFSVGALGAARRRRLVPTRWSITAVDDTVSRSLLEEIRRFPWLSEVQVFTRRYVKNLFVAILVPGAWSFEWMEAWFPGTVWNRSKRVEVEGDWEKYRGRSTYASIGGCYYAARLAVCEYLVRVRRQAIAVLLREIYEGFDVPIGVWFVRENLRRMFSSRPLRFDSVSMALSYLSTMTRLPLKTWISRSKLIRELLTQERIEDFM